MLMRFLSKSLMVLAVVRKDMSLWKRYSTILSPNAIMLFDPTLSPPSFVHNQSGERCQMMCLRFNVLFAANFYLLLLFIGMDFRKSLHREIQWTLSLLNPIYAIAEITRVGVKIRTACTDVILLSSSWNTAAFHQLPYGSGRQARIGYPLSKVDRKYSYLPCPLRCMGETPHLISVCIPLLHKCLFPSFYCIAYVSPSAQRFRVYKMITDFLYLYFGSH